MTEHPTMQDKILHALRALITEQQIEAVQQPVYANTGTLYAQREFETLLVLTATLDEADRVTAGRS